MKRNWTFNITKDGTLIPQDITPLLPRDPVNAPLPKTLIAEVRFKANHNVQLIAVTTTTSDYLLKSISQLEEAICTILPSATGLEKDL